MKNIPIASQIPEIWGGIECTINRTGNHYKDQLELTGHYDRPGDIGKLAELGIKSLRYPILWERHQPVRHQTVNWDWAARQITQIAEHGITIIAGLLHHGSGPSYTHLLDPDFPELFADYAFQLARRFPWLTRFTPVNEPLTTARFSGLYGHWFPHHRNDFSFYKMLLQQLKATRMAMEAIRSVIPAAQLVQTEDLGKTHSTPTLDYQAQFENDRRWLTFDLLTGQLDPEGAACKHMLESGITERELGFFNENPVKPDLLGLNYYVTSERWLDERVSRYPTQTLGGNGAHRYADTEVVRANPKARSGFKHLAAEVWQRYEIPLAVTEAHLNCTREEQLRWFTEIWNDSAALCADGIPVKGVTSWAMLGSYHWDSLLTRSDGHYESGAFDADSVPGKLRPTAMAHLIKTISSGRKPDHPLLKEKGWWVPPGSGRNKPADASLLVLGNPDKNSDFQEICTQRGIPCRVTETTEDLRLTGTWGVILLPDFSARSSEIFEQELTDRCRAFGIPILIYRNYRADTWMRIIHSEENLTQTQIHDCLNYLLDEAASRWHENPAGKSFIHVPILERLKELQAG